MPSDPCWGPVSIASDRRGGPFVDIVEFLRRSHAKAIGELTIPRRQDGAAKDGRRTAPQERSDVQLAAIFSGRALLPGEDEIAARILSAADDEYVKCRRWDQTADLPSLLKKIFEDEFSAKDGTLQSKFEQFLGAVRNQRGYLNFENGCSDGASDWQILCVTRTQPGGSIHLNRHIKETYRGERLKKAIESNHVPHYRDWFRFIKPRGAEQIRHGDKVIRGRNHFRSPRIYVQKMRGSEDEYIANGEIGMVVGQCAYGKSNPRFTQVEFSGRPDRSFSFAAGAFREEGQPYLELAHAITVHKAQGSDFDTVVLVLPAHSRLLSREMIYTALTRQKRRIWILHQGPLDTVLAYRHYSFSDIAARFTNLLREHRPLQVPNPVGLPPGLLPLSRGFLEERLVHGTIRGEMVSSKSELAIANILYSLEREGRLTLRRGTSTAFCR